MNRLDFSISATGAQQLKTQGNYLRYLKCTVGTASPGIAFRTDRGDVGILYPGEDVTVAEQFTNLEITNFDAALTVTGILATAGQGERYTAARIAGSVSISGSIDAITAAVTIIDYEKTLALAGSAYSSGTAISGIAANFAHVQCANPAASGKVLLLRRVIFGQNTAGYIYFGNSSTVLTGASGFGTPVNNYAKTSPTATVGVVKRQNLAAQDLSNVAGFYVPANVPFDLKFSRPRPIDPGFSFMAQSGQTSVDLAASFEWDEQ